MFVIYIFLLLSSSAIIDSNGLVMAQKLEAIGGKGGKQWDDGADYDYVTKVYIRGGREGIHYIKFDYVKDGQAIDGSFHGVLGDGFTHTLEIDQSNYEHIVSIDGYYDDKTGVMQALQFKTNLKTFELIGYPKGATKFSLGVNGKIMIGFHGFAGKSLNSLGAYVTAAPPIKSELVGGLYGGIYWDDGPNYDGVKKMYVTYTNYLIRSISTDYDKDGQVVTSYHGSKDGETKEFAIDYPNEYLTSVSGTYNTIPEDGVLVVRSLIFKTSKGRISPTYGFVSGTEFVFERQGYVINGFHGRDGGGFDAIGVYFKPMVTS
ncbi:Jacalin-like lectin domain [Arabidopsis thaliana x Arabidopsis arenosa]|uniref:Jacalin-like lectin domain n=1 Tax=Arabidopsis thaliana x Arabidopsis arenosa TaxID=1240361 RepID=A0A8T2C9G4_9BRAS|nr:Jacalin-like lectin domain [Arabidopsis thaliana x Arabidopsis arenosa]